MNSAHGNGCCQSEDSVVQNCAVLPFRKKTLAIQRSELGVSQPHSGQIRLRAASADHGLDTHYPVLAAITLRPFHAQLLKASQVMLGDGWYGRTFFCSLDESSEGFQQIS